MPLPLAEAAVGAGADAFHAADAGAAADAYVAVPEEFYLYDGFPGAGFGAGPAGGAAFR